MSVMLLEKSVLMKFTLSMVNCSWTFENPEKVIEEWLWRFYLVLSQKKILCRT